MPNDDMFSYPISFYFDEGKPLTPYQKKMAEKKAKKVALKQVLAVRRAQQRQQIAEDVQDVDFSE
jgi:hypothetical protein